MQSAVAAKPAGQMSELRLLNTREALTKMSALSESIALRAFEIFESRGRANGNDQDDWFRAEAELFHSTHVDVAESGDVLEVRAEVPGFSADELEVSLERRRVTITGKRETNNHEARRRIIFRDQCSDQIFRVLDLPMEVDPKKSTATLKDGILELAMQKAASAQSSVETKTYCIVRAEDYRMWTESFVRLLQGHGRRAAASMNQP